MPIDIAQEKQQVHELIDRLAPAEVAAVRGLLEVMLEARVNAAVDDEPVTAEDQARFREGQVWLAQHGGKGIPMEQVLAEFRVKSDDFPAASDHA